MQYKIDSCSIGDCTDMALPMGIYWCQANNNLVIQFTELMVPTAYCMPAHYKPELIDNTIEEHIANKDSQLIGELKNILAVAIHPNAAQELMRNGKD